jgi:hypothetical protein
MTSLITKLKTDYNQVIQTPSSEKNKRNWFKKLDLLGIKPFETEEDKKNKLNLKKFNTHHSPFQQ